MRTRVLPTVMLSFALLMGTFLYIFHRMYEQRLREIRETTSRRAEDLTRTELRNYVDTMSAALKSIIRDRRLEAEFIADDRQKAIALADPLFRELQRELHIDHFYLHRAN